MAGQAAQPVSRRPQPPAEIPDRLYFRIGDVARICGVAPYVLRFWETQFPALKPNKSGTGQRLYRRREVELAVRIQQLVHQEGYTLAGARQALESKPRIQATHSQAPAPGTQGRGKQARLPLGNEQALLRLEAASAAIGRARAELREIARQLSVPEPTVNRRRPRVGSMRSQTGLAFPW